jgi:hypothetical protein
MEVHFESKICPQVRQWCFRLKVVKASPQLKQSFAFSSLIQNSLSSIFLRICVKVLRGRLLTAGFACACLCISLIGGTVGARMVEVVTTELMPSEEEVLDV